MEKFLTVEEAARSLRVSADTVRRWLRAGRLRAVKFGQVYRIPESAIQENVGPTARLPWRPVASEPRDDYRQRMAAALALAEQLDPVIRAGTRGRIDIAGEISAMRDERTREISGDER